MKFTTEKLVFSFKEELFCNNQFKSKEINLEWLFLSIVRVNLDFVYFSIFKSEVISYEPFNRRFKFFSLNVVKQQF